MKIWLLGTLLLTSGQEEGGDEESIPLLYGTDLFHPHDDPDDHFDLASIYAMPELDLKGIILDHGKNQLRRPGRIPVSQMNRITGRDVPAAIGLGDRLKSPSDTGLDQDATFQEGVRLILETLRRSPVPVRIAMVGSVRDLAAAYNRDPLLLKAKVDRVLVFIGEATHPTFREWNVHLDPHAYVGLMRSELPIWWVPCFDGGLWQNRGRASFWKAKHQDLLEGAAPEVIQFFIYAMEHEKSDPIKFLSSPVDPGRRARLFAMERNLWCTVIFGVLSGRSLRFENGRWVSIRPEKGRARGAPPANDLFGFSEVHVSIGDDALTRLGKSEGSRPVMLFEVKDRGKYAEGMTALTAGLLSSLRPAR